MRSQLFSSYSAALKLLQVVHLDLIHCHIHAAMRVRDIICSVTSQLLLLLLLIANSAAPFSGWIYFNLCFGFGTASTEEESQNEPGACAIAVH